MSRLQRIWLDWSLRRARKSRVDPSAARMWALFLAAIGIVGLVLWAGAALIVKIEQTFFAQETSLHPGEGSLERLSVLPWAVTAAAEAIIVALAAWKRHRARRLAVLAGLPPEIGRARLWPYALLSLLPPVGLCIYGFWLSYQSRGHLL